MYRLAKRVERIEQRLIKSAVPAELILSRRGRAARLLEIYSNIATRAGQVELAGRLAASRRKILAGDEQLAEEFMRKAARTLRNRGKK